LAEEQLKVKAATSEIKKLQDELKKIQKEIRSKGFGNVTKADAERLRAARKKFERKKLESFQTATILAGGLAFMKAGVSVVRIAFNPPAFIKQQVKAFNKDNRKETFNSILREMNQNPVGFFTEMWAFTKILNLAGVGLKKLPITRFLYEEWNILKFPLKQRRFVRSIIKSAKIQESLNPTKLKTLKKVDILKIEQLSVVEAKVLLKTMGETSSVSLGNAFLRKVVGRQSKGLTIATENAAVFNRVFLKNLPKNLRKQFVIRGNSLVRRTTGKSFAKNVPVGSITSRLPKLKVSVKLKPGAKLKLAAAKVRMTQKIAPLVKIAGRVSRRVKRVIRVGGEKVSAVNQKVLTSVKTNMGGLGITIRFVKFRVGVKIGELSSPTIKALNTQFRLLKRTLNKAGNVVNSKVLRIANKINALLKNANIKVKFAKFKLGTRLGVLKESIAKPVLRTVRKGKRVVRISGEVLSKVNQRVVNKIRTGLGNLEIRVKFTKFRVNQKIKNIGGVVERVFDKRIRLLRRSLTKSKGVITRPILAQINKLRTLLKNANIRMSFVKYRIGQKLGAVKELARKKVSGVTRPVKRFVRVSGEALNKVNSGVVNSVKKV